MNLRLKIIVVCSISLSLTQGCSSLTTSFPGATETPQLDAKFGNAVRTAKAAMIIDPNAAKGANTAHSLDATSANNSTEAYQKSFSVRPVITSEPQAGSGAK
jgi:hypothetical protein